MVTNFKNPSRFSSTSNLYWNSKYKTVILPPQNFTKIATTQLPLPITLYHSPLPNFNPCCPISTQDFICQTTYTSHILLHIPSRSTEFYVTFLSKRRKDTGCGAHKARLLSLARKIALIEIQSRRRCATYYLLRAPYER